MSTGACGPCSGGERTEHAAHGSGYDSGGGRRSHDPPVLRVEREEAGTRATKREHSITLAAPVGDEADSPDQVLASTLLGAKGA